MITEREIIIAIVDNDCLAKSDAAILLEGDGFNRLEKAAELYRSGLVSKVVFSGNVVDKDYGSFPYEEIRPLLLSKGVSESDLIHENISMNTHQQAVQITKMAREKRWKKLILVASPEHQYRAYLTFLREVIDANDNLIVFNAPARGLPWFIDDGWGDRFGRLANEFDRIEKYSQLGHLASVEEAVNYQKWKENFRGE